MDDSRRPQDERLDYDALAERLGPRLTFDAGTMHTLGDVAAHVVAELWTREHWDHVARVTDEIQALCGFRDTRAGPVCLSRQQADALYAVADGLKVLANSAAEYGARWGYALAQTAEDYRHGRAAWLGAAAATAGREGCDLEAHDWWLDWWTHDKGRHLEALRRGERYEPVPHPGDKEEEGSAA